MLGHFSTLCMKGLSLKLKIKTKIVCLTHFVKGVRIRSFSGTYFPSFRLNTERYSVYIRIKSECGKIRTRKTPNRNTFHEVTISSHFMKSGEYYYCISGKLLLSKVIRYLESALNRGYQYPFIHDNSWSGCLMTGTIAN